MRFKNNCYLAFLVYISLHGNVFGQNSGSNGQNKERLLQAAKEIMNEAGLCALITLDAEGRPRVRAMDPFKPENDMVVWLATNPKSRKVSQIQNDRRVTLYYMDKDNSGYVMIHGHAQLVNDKKEKERRWKKGWKKFYPNREDGYLLIQVIPNWLEIVSNTRGIVGNSTTWLPDTVVFNNKK